MYEGDATRRGPRAVLNLSAIPSLVVAAPDALRARQNNTARIETGVVCRRTPQDCRWLVQL
jgi:hypothetical protein